MRPISSKLFEMIDHAIVQIEANSVSSPLLLEWNFIRGYLNMRMPLTEGLKRKIVDAVIRRPGYFAASSSEGLVVMSQKFLDVTIEIKTTRTSKGGIEIVEIDYK